MDTVTTVVRLLILCWFIVILLASVYVYFTAKSREDKIASGCWVGIIVLSLWLVAVAAKTGSII